MFNPASWAQARGGGGGGFMGVVRKLVVLAFAVVQLALVARVLLDIGLIPVDWDFSPNIVSWSDLLAAPVAGIGGGLGDLLGGGGIPGVGPSVGAGLNPVMLAALAGWTIVEGLVLRVVAKFASV